MWTLHAPSWPSDRLMWISHLLRRVSGYYRPDTPRVVSSRSYAHAAGGHSRYTPTQPGSNITKRVRFIISALFAAAAAAATSEPALRIEKGWTNLVGDLDTEEH